MLTRIVGRVLIPGSRIQGSCQYSGFLKVSKLGPVGVFCSRWMSSETGKRFVAMWGSGDYGRLGLGNLDSQWRPSVCSALSDHSIRAVACGGAHTLFLTETRRVFATGLNDCGQLGVSDVKSHAMEPLEVSGLKKDILHISAGYYHSAAITMDGELYMWGKNSSGQLGLGKKAAKVVHVPTKVQALHGITIKSVALGSEHSIAITDGGEVLSWGGGGSGRLGHGHESSLFGILRSKSMPLIAVSLLQGLSRNLRGSRLKMLLLVCCIQYALMRMALHSCLERDP